MDATVPVFHFEQNESIPPLEWRYRGWRHFNPHPFSNPALAAGLIASGLFMLGDREIV
ncbi:hypothetical protein [Bradyrhizobium sp. CCBAU 11386]|uniref:hypothetical protein n=1 Tax=Bradyrhizobium sp. CCBAU 11386 TaxID=1630837 RepID=UPI002303A7DF|nr:hypothetical protein [Bradyrhizobium sp. CCBAU 11386]